MNPWNKLSEDYSVHLIELSYGYAVDERAYPDLQDMMGAARAAGQSSVIYSSYRTQETQQRLFSNKVNHYLVEEYSREEAESEAGKWVAIPDTSEHQTGLAVGIVALSAPILKSNKKLFNVIC